MTKPVAKNHEGFEVNHCEIGNVATEAEAKLYQRFHKMHCEKKSADHQCSGRITVSRNNVTLQCPLCGDSRKAYAAIVTGKEFPA